MEDLIGRAPRRKISCALSQGLNFSKGPLRGRERAARAARARTIRPESKKRVRTPKRGPCPFSDPERGRVRWRWDFYRILGAFETCFEEN